MKTKAVLTEQDVAQLLVAAKELAHQRQWAVSVCVVDDGGHPLGLLRLDDASPLSAYIATEKARTAAMGRRDKQGFRRHDQWWSLRVSQRSASAGHA